MFAAMGIALLLMDFVLVLQFESFAPMGRAIIGGVVNSTLLTLLVIPAIYELMDKGGSARCG